MKVNFLQNVDADRRYHFWYGGEVAEVVVSDKFKIVISAIGDVIGDIYKKGEYVTSFKDKYNTGEFLHVADSYIKDDKVLEEALEMDYVDEDYLEENKDKDYIVAFTNHNWWEAIPVVNGEYEDVMWALDAYSIDDAIQEVKDSYAEVLANI